MNDAMILLAQQRDAQVAGALAGVFIFLIFFAAMGILLAVSFWVIFNKAGEPGWAAIVPIYHDIVFFRVSGNPEWWAVFFLFPPILFILKIIACISLAERFGRSGAFAVGLILLGPIFFPILAFGSSQYEGRRGRRRRRDDYDDDEDDYERRPRRRSRDDDEDDDPRPRRRSRDDDEDDDPRPRRRRSRDDDD